MKSNTAMIAVITIMLTSKSDPLACLDESDHGAYAEQPK